MTWKYCPSGANPADLLTRGLTFQQFQSSSLWTCGPKWLPDKVQWPKWDQSPTSHLHAVAAITDDFLPNQEACPFEDLHLIITVIRFSKLRKLLVVTAHVHRFIHNICHPTERQRGPITAQELHKARMDWIHSCQNEVYWKDIRNLSTPKQTCLMLYSTIASAIHRSQGTSEVWRLNSQCPIE